MKIPTVTERIRQLERQVVHLADALAFVMKKLEHTVASPIIGGESKTLSMLELYRDNVKAKKQAAQAIKDAQAELGTVQ